MKNLILLSFLLSLIMVTSCDKNNDDAGANASSGTLTATIDGMTFDFSATSQCNRGTINDTPGLFFFGRHDDGQFNRRVEITLVNVNNTGAYILEDVFANSGYYEFVPSGGGAVTAFSTHGGANGIVNVTELTSSRITGTFSFEATDVNGGKNLAVVTNGVFDLAISD